MYLHVHVHVCKHGSLVRFTAERDWYDAGVAGIQRAKWQADGHRSQVQGAAGHGHERNGRSVTAAGVQSRCSSLCIKHRSRLCMAAKSSVVWGGGVNQRYHNEHVKTYLHT